MKWSTSQKHELHYASTQELSIWNIPYSAEYWQSFLHLHDVHGVGVEIGCGTHGIYNFVPNIVGVDTLNFHTKNCIQASAECLPFKRVDVAILCNSLDHCDNPQKVIAEVINISSTIVLWTYVYPKAVSWMLSKFDKLHPHHFTKEGISFLLKHATVMHDIPYSPWNFRRFTKSRIMKIKLLAMYLLNIRGKCIYAACLTERARQ